MSSELPDWFIRAFAMPRLSPYLATAETTGIEADGLYRDLGGIEQRWCPPDTGSETPDRTASRTIAVLRMMSGSD
jgi:hypothetical protein